MDFARRPAASALACVARLCALLLLTLLPAGCNVFGVAANALPEPDVPARYAGLRGHTVGVMVWADRGVQIDYPSLRLDIATAVQAKLAQARNAKRPEVAGVAFPFPAASFVRYQEDHPELADQPVVELAPRLKVDRLIYVEVGSLQTRADPSSDLYRGTAEASVKVIAVDPSGKAEAVYEESGLGASFPDSAPPEGYPGLSDALVYRGTVDRLSTVIAFRFFSHPPQ